MQDLRIIHPRGEKHLLSVATVRDYERDHWSLASSEVFNLEDSDRAWDHAYELAERHGLIVEDDRREGRRHDFLDGKEPLGKPMIYQWKSERFKDYYRGSIMVAARSLAEARSKAVEKYKLENPTWDTQGSMGVHQYRDLIADIMAEPDVAEVAFGYGAS